MGILAPKTDAELEHLLRDRLCCSSRCVQMFVNGSPFRAWACPVFAQRGGRSGCESFLDALTLLFEHWRRVHAASSGCGRHSGGSQVGGKLFQRLHWSPLNAQIMLRGDTSMESCGVEFHRSGFIVNSYVWKRYISFWKDTKKQNLQSRRKIPARWIQQFGLRKRCTNTRNLQENANIHTNQANPGLNKPRMAHGHLWVCVSQLVSFFSCD